MDFSIEDRAIVAAIDTGPACSKVPAEVSLIERCSKTIEDCMVERTVQFAALCRYQRAPDPEVHQLIDLELPDRIQHTNRSIRSESRTTCVDRTVKAFGVEREFDVLMDLSININTSVVDTEAVAPLVSA